ncbi:class III signal peptide-containing protein [Candidatus Micrarchaeota archaeon]|nr:class III signal peptide-containing protein [Candidatus Micrarchaeota archaeon]MBU1929989.1 class III signal peptide-containing protein [Candidatus Micrarchaeota archaeon]
MKLLHEKRAQGTLEYIAIIAGAIIVATVVGLALKSMGNTLGGRAGESIGETAE